MIDKKLIFIDLEAASKEEVINALASEMITAGKARDTYLRAVLEREREYPTGLPLEGVNIAMPHTFAQHVIEPTIAVARLKQPVRFIQMGTKDQALEVQLVLMMAINDPQQQLGMLKKIMRLFANSEVLKQVMQSVTVEELYQVLQCINE